MTAEFFSTLYAGQSGILELRTFGPEDSDQSATAKQQRIAAYRLRDFVPVVNGQIDMRRMGRFIDGCTAAKLGAFFAVALRTPQAAIDRKGSAPYCQTLTALFVDADFKYLGEVETRKRIAEFSTSPSIVVNSGGGLHPYELLRQPLDLRADYNRARTLLQRLAWSMSGIVDVSVSEPARVLRIPGSVNFKYTPPRPVVLEQITDARIDAQDLSSLPAVPAPSASSGSTSSGSTPAGQPLHLPDAIIKGDRHEWLRRAGRSLLARGVPLAGVLAACKIENQAKCRPLLDPDALEAHLKRVFKYPDRPDFIRTQQTAWEIFGGAFEIGLSAEAVMAACRSVDPNFDPMKPAPVTTTTLLYGLRGL